MLPRLPELASPGETPTLAALLTATGELHQHACPRQVLGLRMGLLGGAELGLPVPQPPASKRLLAIVETDGCFADGVAVATHCWVGRRTLRVEDYGKIAATFVDKDTGRAVRVVPQPEARGRAGRYAPEARNRWEAYLLGYQRMPADELLAWQAVTLATPLERLVSRFDRRSVCQTCGEEVINEREVLRAGVPLCRACAEAAYYRPAPPPTG